MRDLKLQVNQKNKSFTPYISIIQKGQPVEFANQDDITHHIFSASRDQRFSFKIRSGDKNSDVQFNQVAKISMGCNIHDWMSGYLLVLDTPYFEKTDKNGRVEFKLDFNKNAKINIWHPQMREDAPSLSKDISISKSGITVNFHLVHPLDSIPAQESGEDFDFLDDY